MALAFNIIQFKIHNRVRCVLCTLYTLRVILPHLSLSHWYPYLENYHINRRKKNSSPSVFKERSLALDAIPYMAKRVPNRYIYHSNPIWI